MDGATLSRFSIGSRIGFGTSSLHHLAGVSKRNGLLESAFDAGIRYFDTAPLYGHGAAERVLGRFVRNHRSDANIVVGTKIGLVPNAIVSAMPPLLLPYIALRTLTTRLRILSHATWQPKHDYSADNLVQRVERSLREMGLDCLDVVYLHEPLIEDLQLAQDLAEAAAALKQRGLVKAFGISGQHDVARWLQQQAPELCEVMQLEVPAQADAELASWFAMNAGVTFGHFRMLQTE